MKTNFTVRLITSDDAAGALAVYKPYVETTSVTFEYEVPSPEEFQRRILAVIPEFPWLVCECGNQIIGYAYAHKHRERIAYQWSPESTIYFSQNYHGRGLAKILYEALFSMLKLQGFVNVYAGVLSTNAGSNKLHRTMGFKEIGLFNNIGYKLGEWHSNMWYELQIAAHTQPATPKKMADVINNSHFLKIIERANEKSKSVSQIAG